MPPTTVDQSSAPTQTPTPSPAETAQAARPGLTRREYAIGPKRPRLEVTVEESPLHVRVSLHARIGEPAILHWGLCSRPGAVWRCPPRQARPEGSRVFDEKAAQTPFTQNADGESILIIDLPHPMLWGELAFVLYLPDSNTWIKNGRYDFSLDLPCDRAGRPLPSDVAAAWLEAAGRVAKEEDSVRLKVFALDSGEQLAIAGYRDPAAPSSAGTGDTHGTPATNPTDGGVVHILLVTDADTPLHLHWGLSERSRHQWIAPPAGLHPPGTDPFDKHAVRTPFTVEEGIARLTLTFPAPVGGGPGPQGINLLLYQPEEDLWLKVDNNDIHIPLFAPTGESPFPSERLREMTGQIVEAEVGKSSWTLMHRFHLCHDLLDDAGSDETAFALLFVWLRYSAIRQLDWQRHFNTRPRLLSEAQNRLTARLAGIWRDTPAMRIWVRRMLSTVGRGGDAGQGQQIRDEILNIMHRHHIKENNGLWMEQWHQKLHNNTTPDDIGICKAYLAFLDAGGDTQTYWRVLEENGITAERLEALERPIRNTPEYMPDKRDGLKKDFEHYLWILESVHGGMGLQVAYDRARPSLDPAIRGKVDAVLAARGDGGTRLTDALLAARNEVMSRVEGMNDEHAILDHLYLDLALEGVFRGLVEQDGGGMDRGTLENRLEAALRHAELSTQDPAFAMRARHWDAFRRKHADLPDAPLHAWGIADSIAATLQRQTAHLANLVQPIAVHLGQEFDVDAWTIPLFAEEVIRSEMAFVLSLLLRRLTPKLREHAGLGDWQVISPATTSGVLRCVTSLESVQETTYKEPTLLVAQTVGGHEEIPEGVVGILTPDAPDLVSHVAVRARNMHVLLAVCYADATLATLRAREGERLTLRVTASGSVEATDAPTVPQPTENPGDPVHVANHGGSPSRKGGQTTGIHARPFSSWCLKREDFNRESLGGKSNNLQHLRGRLPDEVRIPASMALPFGAFEGALAHAENDAIRKDYETLLQTLTAHGTRDLPRIRACIHRLHAPAPLREAVESNWDAAGLPTLAWDAAWTGIRTVWASKWNERAFLSRQHLGIAHDALQMAVLVQEVIEAEYAFVVHTANPINGKRDEILIEAVLGLGETLVGNDPGRALGAVVRKDDTIELLTYPGKPLGLYGRGVIFRSDSNGEDLEGFAGAGLYDSVLAKEPDERWLDYSNEPLVWDASFRDGFLQRVAAIARAVEAACAGVPQDIEGAYAKGVYAVVQTRPQVGLDSA